MPLLAGVCLAVWHFVQSRTWARLIPLILLAPAVFISVSATHRYAGEWTEAGEIARRIVRGVAPICHGADPNARLLFSGVPSMHKHATVFMTSFDVAFRRCCPQFSGQVLTETEVANHAGSAPKVREFRFDPGRGTFVEVRR